MRFDYVNAGARDVNISSVPIQSPLKDENTPVEVLNHARRSDIVVLVAGKQEVVEGSAIIRVVG